MKNPTVLLLVLDAIGITTLEFLLRRYHGSVRLPNLANLGLSDLLNPHANHDRIVCDGRDAYAAAVLQASADADSTIGHREMVGVIDMRHYGLFPDGFPWEYIRELKQRIGHKTLFNKMAGGMEAIERNDENHRRTGWPIVYASKCDPLIQIAANEAVIPPARLHEITRIAFDLAMEKGLRITRAIARPYVADGSGGFDRTVNRRDVVLPVGGRTLIEILRDRNVWTVSVGKPADLLHVPFDEEIHLTDRAFLDPAMGLRFPHPKGKDTNPFTFQGIVNALRKAHTVYSPAGTFIFANAVDTDALYGHAQDVEGTLRSLEETDHVLPRLQDEMQDGDLLLVTADHGMRHAGDYGYHNREPLPLLAWRKGFTGPDIELRIMNGKNLTHVGDLVAQMFDCAFEFRQTIFHIPE